MATLNVAKTFSIGASALFAGFVASACSGTTPALSTMGTGGSAAPEVTSNSGRVQVRYEPGEGASISLGAMPWPDDLYLDRNGRVSANGLLEGSEPARLTDALSDLDGFGVSTPVYFYLDGLIDPDTLPKSDADSLEANASVFLIDADTGSPEAFTKQPVIIQWQSGPRRLAMRPADGHPLTPGRRYAAVVTRRVKDRLGRDLEPAPKFALIRDPDTVLTDPRLSAARAQYTPVIETLVKTGLKRQDISAIAVFHVQSVDRDLIEARRIVRSGRSTQPALEVIAATELDRVLGSNVSVSAGFDDNGRAPHENLYAMVHGTLMSPNLLSATANMHGTFERDEGGQLRVKRHDTIWFTLFVPRTSLKAPIVIYQHQRDRERSDALAIANELAGRGVAVLALDAPFQGLRAKTPEDRQSVDWQNRFTSASTADGFGDAPGDFFGFEAAKSAGRPWNPLHARDAMRQGVVDLMVAVRAIEDGSLAAAASANVKLKERTFLGTHLAFIGEDVGASLGMMLARVEPSVQAVVLVAPAGGMISQWAWSATDEPLFETVAEQLGRGDGPFDRDADDPRFWPDAAIYQTLFDRADPLAHVAALRRAPVNVMVLMAQDDETVPNRATEAYAAALGTTLVGSEPRYVGDLKREDLRDEGFSANYLAGGSWVTRATYVLSPATHNFLRARTDQQRFVHPPEPPFAAQSPRVTVQNPTAAAVRQVGQYLESYFECVNSGSTLPTGACPASL